MSGALNKQLLLNQMCFIHKVIIINVEFHYALSALGAVWLFQPQRESTVKEFHK